jgi:hypothetical protein
VHNDGININDELIPVGFLATADLVASIGESDALLEDSSTIDRHEDDLIIPGIDLPELDLDS